MYFIGIDPGCSGAIVVISGGFPIDWSEMHTYMEGSNTRVNATALASFLRPYAGKSIACVELVHSMPGQGVRSTFSFGHACGAVMGVLGALEIPVRLVTPQAWKKTAGLIGSEKDAARSQAILTWPKWDVLAKKGKGQALADAAFIALHGEKT